MVKTYLRYSLTETFGVIAPMSSNCIYDSETKKVISGGVQNVLVWNMRTGAAVKELVHDQATTCLARHRGRNNLAVGHANGQIRLWDLEKDDVIATYFGHHRAVTSLCFDEAGDLLISGSADTNIIVWDLIGETGLFRLRGHTSEITGVTFFNGQQLIVSSSKDGLLKIWDNDTQHCVQTITGHRREIWSICVLRNMVLTGSKDDRLRVYEFQSASASDHTDPFQYKGYIPRKDSQRVSQLEISDSLLICQSAGKVLEFFKVLSAEEMKKKMDRKKKREKEREKKRKEKVAATASDADDATAAAEKNDEAEDVLPIIVPLTTFHSRHKIASISLSHNELLVACSNNTLSVLAIDPAAEVSALYSEREHLSLPGHRGDIRSVCLNSTNELLLSAGPENLKVWDVATRNSIKTISCEVCYCCSFLPGDNSIVVGTKSGLLRLFDLQTGELIQEAKEHQGTIWSLAIRPDKRGMVSVSEDHTAVFWAFELVSQPDRQRKFINVRNQRVLKMNADILNVQYTHHESSSELMVILALMDHTVKAFFDDSLKFHLSFYGHKLPVLSLSVSSDNALLVTGSADKNIKIWGLEFGDCHRSLFAHSESVMQVSFVPNTHYFFSCGRDGLVKYWDADRFEQILSLEGHVGEAWSLCVSSLGNFVISSGHDRSLRVWERMDEMVFAQEERQKAMDKRIEEEMVKEQQMHDTSTKESEAATTTRLESLDLVERLMETLDLAKRERALDDAYAEELKEAEKSLSEAARRKRASSKTTPPPLVPPPKHHPLLLGKPVDKFVFDKLKQIPSTELQSTLLLLPFTTVECLLDFLSEFLQRRWDIEMCMKCLKMILKVHYKAISVSREFQPLMQAIRNEAHAQLEELKDAIGSNIAGLNFYKRKLAVDAVTLPEPPAKRAPA